MLSLRTAPAQRTMRILIFNLSYPPVACGVGEYTQGLATALVRAGHDVTVVTGATSTSATEGPPRVLPVLRDGSVRAFLRAWPRFARPRPDLVVSSFPTIVEGNYARLLYLFPVLAKALLGWPRTTFIVHEFLRIGETERRLLMLPLRAADRIVTVNEGERDAIVARYPWATARIVVRHNAPNIPVAAIDAAADARLRATFAPDERPVIAFFGHIMGPTKGFEELLEALARTDALLVASGSLDPSDPYKAHLLAQIERLGLAERVRWLGYIAQEDVGRVLRTVDAVVLPYHGGAESGYTSMLAALVNGAAVITTRGPQTPPWLRDGETALLVDSTDPATLASAIERVLADEGLAQRLRASGSELVFGWDEIVEAVTAPAHPTAVGSGEAALGRP
jgi:glycosyltransferase involved in cell wall biosynthesis